MSDVVTGEAVALDLRRAGLPSRLLAGGIDLAIQFVGLYAVLTGVLLLGAGSGEGNVLAIVSIVLVLLVFFGYPIALETLTRGRTVGKMAMGLRAVRVDGGPITFRQALVRGLLAGLLEKPGIMLGLTVWIGVLAMLINTDCRRIGDLAAGTMVIRERVPSTRLRSDVVFMPPPLAGWASLLDLGRLDDGLALSARQYLARLGELSPAAADALGRQLAGSVAAVTTPPPPVGTPPWAYLAAVLAERRRRSLPPAFTAAPPPAPQQPAYPPLRHQAPPAPGAFAPPR